jgi:hypothetical protein
MTPIRFRDNSRATVSTLSRVMVSTAAWLASAGQTQFRLEIRHTTSSTTVYDSQPGDPDTAPATTPLGGGNITIHEQ